MEAEIKQIVESVKLSIAKAKDLASLTEVVVKSTGRKSRLTEILRSISELNPDERRQVGFLANEAKVEIERLAGEKQTELEIKRAESMHRDVTLPGIKPAVGHLSPITIVMRELIKVLAELGFEIAEGPEAELELYNFDLLNIPAEHPARDEWDTFWLKQGSDSRHNVLLRTHTSPVQIRYMLDNKPPIRIISPGRTFRYEAEDATHAAVFSQMEGLMVDKNLSVANLKAVITYFVKRVLGDEKIVRFRPSFFPFTEPSFEVDVWFNGKWLELMGCGMVSPQVLRNVGIDPKIYSGFAFGVGIERLTMLKYNISDIRLFLNGDPRFANQF
ncbi:phenylalanine--tRNA ligase subunit alpha [Patescibacteria group bacterium]|nr:phenylalanine--tRNA ligase subunit alpha [Patescibacteria group bacterium]